MPNLTNLAGGQPQKQTKFAPMYTGRFFSGIWTNRSPLRDASTTRLQEKFYGGNGDALIDGLNVEVSNRLTLIRRPGAPIFNNINTFSDVLGFDEFRVNKAIDDDFGATLESIYTMVSEPGALSAVLGSGGTTEAVFSGATNGQSFMQSVGNSLYFGNGADNKKWLQSLFMRGLGNNSTAINTDTYPFLTTYLIDSNTPTNIQQFIGVALGPGITNVALASNVLTLTVGDLGFNFKIGDVVTLWGLTTALFLNGLSITLKADYTSGMDTTITADVTHPDYTSAGDTGYVQQTGALPSAPMTGSSVPTFSSTVPDSSNDFMGGLTLDGNVLWMNRGPQVENWGIKPPKGIAPTFSVAGSSVSWTKQTYFSPASVFIDPLGGNLWQITTAGVLGSVQPDWSTPSPVASQKIDVTNVQVISGVATFTTETQSPALIAGDTVVMADFDVNKWLEGQSLVVLASGLSTTQFEANVVHGDVPSAADQGIAQKPGTTKNDGTAVWTCRQLSASLIWTASHHSRVGDFLVNTVGGVQQLFQLGRKLQPFLHNAVAYRGYNGSTNGAFNKFFPAPAADFTTPISPSLHWEGKKLGSGIFITHENTFFYNVNGAGEVGSRVDSTRTANLNWEAAITVDVFIPAPGAYTFSLAHDDGGFFAFDSSTGAYLVLGAFNDPLLHQKTALKGYGGPSGSYLCGNNVSGVNSDSATWNFPAAGVYGLEIDWANWQSSSTMIFKCNGQEMAITPDQSSATPPTWPAFTIAGAQWDTINKEIVWGGKVQEAALQYTWNNIGNVSDFSWNANTQYTLPGTTIIDNFSDEQGAYETGVSGLTAPVFSTTLSAITPDTQPPLQWINEGPVPQIPNPAGKISALTGWIYGVALVNSIDNTVSNIGTLSANTGPVIGGTVTFAPGSGLPTDLTQIDPQADYVAIFRSTDGQAIPLLIPGIGNSFYTVPLQQYLENGYIDGTPDEGLNNLLQAPQNGENTPPLPGAINLSYHLNRIWYSIGNTVYFTTGPLAPIGNGINGTAPGNFDVMPSLVKRLVPCAVGMLVFTVSDIYIIASQGISILPGLPYLTGIGISSYNALDINGSIIGCFTTDSQFVIFDPSSGINYAGAPLGDRFRKNNGQPGTNWNPANVFVAWYVSGEDTGWFVADGQFGWYRLISAPAPESGMCWSPFATIVGGAGAIKSIETSPGVHDLLVGPFASGNILHRVLDASTDGGTTNVNGSTYSAFGVLGSYVLSYPGQVAQVAFITTDSVRVGSPVVLGVIFDEALPYFTGAFDLIKRWESDPPGLPPSKSLIGQRFYMSEIPDTAIPCRHMQVMIQWPPEAAQNELQSFTIFGSYLQEQ